MTKRNIKWSCGMCLKPEKSMFLWQLFFFWQYIGFPLLIIIFICKLLRLKLIGWYSLTTECWWILSKTIPVSDNLAKQDFYSMWTHVCSVFFLGPTACSLIRNQTHNQRSRCKSPKQTKTAKEKKQKRTPKQGPQQN